VTPQRPLDTRTVVRRALMLTRNRRGLRHYHSGRRQRYQAWAVRTPQPMLAETAYNEEAIRSTAVGRSLIQVDGARVDPPTG
jgi:hypothetical protein